MLDDRLRRIKDRVLDEAAAAFPNTAPLTITWIGFAIGMLAVAAALFRYNGTAFVLFFLNRLMDALDGSIARRYQRQSDRGGYLDMLLDMVMYAFLPMALAHAFPAPGLAVALAVLLASFYVNAGSWLILSALLEKRRQGTDGTTSMAMPAGYIEGTETMIFYGLFLLSPSHLTVLYWTMALLVFLTALQRARYGYRILHDM